MQLVQRKMINLRLVSRERTGMICSFGKAERMTCGMVSPGYKRSVSVPALVTPMNKVIYL